MSGDQDTHRAMELGGHVLDKMIDTYKAFAVEDLAEGADDEYGALGGVLIVAQRLAQVTPGSLSRIILALAVKRIVDLEAERTEVKP